MQIQYDYYIASRWRNRDSVLELFHKLEAKGKKVYCFLVTDPYHSPDDDSEEVMQKFEKRENWRNDKVVKHIFETDMEGLLTSEKLLLLLPAGKSSHLEAGIAYGKGKKCILIGEHKETESLYLIFDEWYPTIDAFIQSIK